MEKQLIEIGFSNGLAFGLACNRNRLQLALIGFIIEMNFNVVTDNAKRFVECFKEN